MTSVNTATITENKTTAAQSKPTQNKTQQLFLLTLMASITFMAILCELVPSGILPLIADAFEVRLAVCGSLVGGYAIASALCGLPLVSLTVEWERKKLLLTLLSIFALSNLGMALVPSFVLLLVCRVIGGACAGTLWPMITAYGMQLAEDGKQGQAVTIIMSGITVGMSVGLPLLTAIGIQFGFRAEFLVMGCAIAGIALLCFRFLPAVLGEKRSKANSIVTILHNKGVLLVFALTFLAVGANYGAYTFVTQLVSASSYPSIGTAQLFFGVGCVISVLLTLRFIDGHLLPIMEGMFASGVVTMGLFAITQQDLLLHGAFFLWGLGFGSLSSIFQTATAHQVREGVAIANALQSASFNCSIMLGTTGAGILLEQLGVQAVVIAAAGILGAGLLFMLVNRRFLA